MKYLVLASILVLAPFQAATAQQATVQSVIVSKTTVDAIMNNLQSRAYSNPVQVHASGDRVHYIAMNSSEKWVHVELDAKGKVLAETPVASMNK